jgi:hypothetical protein
LTVTRITLADGENAAPLRRDWITEESPDQSQGPSPSPRWQKIAEVKSAAIFENARVLPRVWLASEAKVLSDLEILNVIRTGKLPGGEVWDPRKMALVEGPFDFASTSSDQTAKVQMIAHEPNRVRLKTKSSQPSILVLSDNHYPGWRAYVDGQFVTNLRVDYNLRGVALPAGEHTIEFVYRPKSVLIGAVISLLTLIGLIVWYKRLLPEDRLLRMMFRPKPEHERRP